MGVLSRVLECTLATAEDCGATFRSLGTTTGPPLVSVTCLFLFGWAGTKISGEESRSNVASSVVCRERQWACCHGCRNVCWEQLQRSRYACCTAFTRRVSESSALEVMPSGDRAGRYGTGVYVACG